MEGIVANYYTLISSTILKAPPMNMSQYRNSLRISAKLTFHLLVVQWFAILFMITILVIICYPHFVAHERNPEKADFTEYYWITKIKNLAQS